MTTKFSSIQATRSVSRYSYPIPVDLLIDIFSRVPAKSIARFHCLSKQWASTLSRPDFTELFFTNSLNRPRLFFTLVSNKEIFFYSSHQPHNPNEDSCFVATRHRSYYYPQYIRSSKCTPLLGLALLQECCTQVICNPVTREFITLPESHIETQKTLPESIGKAIIRRCPDEKRFYIGYDPIGKQFKVLSMMSFYEESNTHLVLTLGSGKRSWRMIDHEFRFVPNLKIYGELWIKGVLYFGAETPDKSTMIVSFDVRSEKFGFINTIEEMSVKGPYVPFSLILFNYKGKIGIYHRDMDRDYLYHRDMDRDTKLVFWVLEDAGDHKWVEHVYPLSDLGKDIVTNNRFVGMTRTCEMVWSPHPSRISYPFYLYFYSLESKTFTRVNIKGFEKFKEDDRLVINTFLDYAESMTFM